MLAVIRQFVARVRRRERAAIAAVLAIGSVALVMGLLGGQAYLEEPCDPLHRSSLEETHRAGASVAAPDALPPTSVAVVPPPPPAEPVELVSSAPLAPSFLVRVVPATPLRGPPARRVI